MAYERKVNENLDRLDQSLARLLTLIKRGEQQDAIRFMTEGELKERFEEMQNIITISQVGTVGARGTTQTGTL